MATDPSLKLDRATDFSIDKIFRAVVKLDGSDLHLKVGQPPYVRVAGSLRPLKHDPIGALEMRDLCYPLMDERNRDIFEAEGGADFAYMIDVDGTQWRFRVNMLTQMGHVGMVARRVNNTIPNFKGLHLPDVIEDLCQFDQGLVLVAGVTGSGKSTTIASMLNWINDHYRKHILTLEDPIEFLFHENKCLINQREIGIDVKNFELGMKHAVREDPDVMLVGEMRDRETFQTAIHAAETGHLVFGTIHASSSASTINRILDLFPQDMHASLRSALETNLKAIVAQKLLPSISTDVSRVPAVEVLIMNSMIRKLVIEEEDEKLADAVRLGSQDKMQDFNMSLKSLIDQALISQDVAMEVSPNKQQLKMVLKGIDVAQGGLL
ncbi:MAG: twitching motility protein PilT [Planctomycetaceae bacterium TMED10]|nr:MAG: twitching motility protein PilT [Planctomycetaceae bacterium TMED10]|tara:strand:- start:1548 stop:2684 length:1137 start_codon:yes stop_codon:yes gene_type:complete